MSIDIKLENFSKLCLIGMSGVGKSYWAEKLKAEGYQATSCDHLICEKILSKINSADEVIASLANWLGFPWENGFAEREEIYLTLENEFMLELGSKHHTVPTVLDSTGSLIYCSPKTLEKIKQNFLVIYFQLSTEQIGKIISNYCTTPRPILWNNNFPSSISNPTPAEIAEHVTLLIKERAARYEDLADLVIASSSLEKCNSAKDLLILIKDSYEQK